MAKPKRNTRGKLLIMARRRVELGTQAKRAEVFAAVAARLGRPVPATKADGYAMLAAFIPEAVVIPRQRRKTPAPSAPGDVNSTDFLLSYAWRRVRMEVLKARGARCECCGATPTDGVRMHVDHIKPRRLFPALALDIGNLQVLCEVCNHGKGNWDQTDWRKDAPIADPMRPRLVAKKA